MLKRLKNFSNKVLGSVSFFSGCWRLSNGKPFQFVSHNTLLNFFDCHFYCPFQDVNLSMLLCLYQGSFLIRAITRSRFTLSCVFDRIPLRRTFPSDKDVSTILFRSSDRIEVFSVFLSFSVQRLGMYVRI